MFTRRIKIDRRFGLSGGASENARNYESKAVFLGFA